MTRIAIFDSGFGSLSIIKSIQKFTKSEIIYFADQKNYPYGKKSKTHLRTIINQTIEKLEENFSPSLIVMASNTPSILFQNYLDSKVIGVLPPLTEASKITKSFRIGILGTQAAIKSNSLSRYIKKTIPKHIRVKKIDATELVDLVESGKFITDKKLCKKRIQKTLGKVLNNKIDVVTLSSTHLPLLLPMLEKEFPHVTFLDPADRIGKEISKRISKLKHNKLRIYTSKDPKLFQEYLRMIGIRNKINFLP